MEDEAGEQGLTPFEQQRLAIIARNRARLEALGIDKALKGLAALVPAKTKPHRKPSQAAAAAAEPQEPSRQSRRLVDQARAARGELPEGVEATSELGMFIVDGECPRCAKKLTSGHERHLAHCTGAREEPSEEQLVAKARARAETEENKLAALEIGGLVDYKPSANFAALDLASLDEEDQDGGGTGGACSTGGSATFIVIGSKMNHYAVKLNSAADAPKERSCECMDHRTRKRDCKHIKLILQQLGLQCPATMETPTKWEQALRSQLNELEAADEEDVQRVKGLEERREMRKAGAAGRNARAAAAAAAAAAVEAEPAPLQQPDEQPSDADEEDGGDGGAATKKKGGKRGRSSAKAKPKAAAGRRKRAKKA